MERERRRQEQERGDTREPTRQPGQRGAQERRHRQGEHRRQTPRIHDADGRGNHAQQGQQRPEREDKDQSPPDDPPLASPEQDESGAANREHPDRTQSVPEGGPYPPGELPRGVVEQRLARLPPADRPVDLGGRQRRPARREERQHEPEPSETDPHRHPAVATGVHDGHERARERAHRVDSRRTREQERAPERRL